MFRIVILLSFTAISSFSIAQKDTAASLNSFDVYYGCRSSFQNFYNQVNTTNNFEFNKPLQMIGIGTSGHFTVNRDGSFYGHFIFSQVIPQAIQIKDSIKLKLLVLILALHMVVQYRHAQKWLVYFFMRGLIRAD